MIASTVGRRRRRGDCRRQRARAARAAVRRAVLLRRGPQDAARRPACRSSTASCSRRKLGTLGEKVERSQQLAAWLAQRVRRAARPRRARAAQLCKADLVTGMVGEFPELQGVMGTHYARLDGEPSQSPPRSSSTMRRDGPGDALPHGAGAHRSASPIASTPSSAASRSASSRPARRTRYGLRRAALGRSGCSSRPAAAAAARGDPGALARLGDQLARADEIRSAASARRVLPRPPARHLQRRRPAPRPDAALGAAADEDDRIRRSPARAPCAAPRPRTSPTCSTAHRRAATSAHRGEARPPLLRRRSPRPAARRPARSSC